MTDSQRAQGVTPALRQDYGRRIAGRQVTVLLPFPMPGLSMVDVGCSPGSITLGLAEAVPSGLVIGGKAG
jgi:ubiquinone/menaquinone biosynthesis C-methylase UbiE